MVFQPNKTWFVSIAEATHSLSMLKRFSLKHSPLPYQTVKTILLSLFFIALGGCAAHHGAAQITSTPTGAQVINVDTGEVLGVTPLLVEWKERRGTRQQILVKLNKEGYYEKTEHFWLNMNSRSAKKAAKTPNLVEVPMRKIGE